MLWATSTTRSHSQYSTTQCAWHSAHSADAQPPRVVGLRSIRHAMHTRCGIHQLLYSSSLGCCKGCGPLAVRCAAVLPLLCSTTCCTARWKDMLAVLVPSTVAVLRKVRAHLSVEDVAGHST